MELGVEIGKLLVALLVLINPFSALSIYLDLTQDHSTKEKRRIARTAALAVFIVIVVFALGGGILLKVLGISVGSFQVGGGYSGFADCHILNERQRQSCQTPN